MAIVKWNDPFAGMMHSPFDDLFNGVWGADTRGQGASAPAMDVYTDDDKSLVAEVQAPGFEKTRYKCMCTTASWRLKEKNTKKPKIRTRRGSAAIWFVKAMRASTAAYSYQRLLTVTM